jgi:integrase
MLRELKIKHVRLPDGRHTCGSVMHARGVPLVDSSAWLGRASPAFTLSVYVHSQAKALRAAAASFDRVVTTRDTETGSGG